MTSHGVPRVSLKEEKSAETRAKELEEIRSYQSLVARVNSQVSAQEFTPALLQQTAELLKRNPEYYTVWNHRRRIYAHEFISLNEQVTKEQITDENRTSQILDIIQLDLQFLFPLLLKFPKCYWIWNHRLWLLQQSSLLLPLATARGLWEEELGLVGKMLTRDSRNFHGWGYRRTVIQNLEGFVLNGTSKATKEFEYTTKMIKINLSNFSAWHNRTKLILRILDEKSATDRERREMLDEGSGPLDFESTRCRLTGTELALIHKALFDPYDQSLWFYYQTLMCTFEESTASQTMAPNLTTEQRLDYVRAEQDFLEEVLEEAQDCKWVYQALIDCLLRQAKMEGSTSAEQRASMKAWLEKLQSLDPLRKGRWLDLAESLQPAGADEEERSS